jgi:hypothetical protein
MNSSSKRNMPTWVFGLVCGVALTVYVRALDLSRIIYTTSWGAYVGYLAILILPACIYLAFRELRKKQPLLFRQAMLSGLFVSVLTATVYSAYVFVDLHFFDARHLSNLFEYTVSDMRRAGYSAAEIQAKLSSMKQHYYSARPFISTYISYMVLGAFFSLVFYFMLRRSGQSKNQII